MKPLCHGWFCAAIVIVAAASVLPVHALEKHLAVAPEEEFFLSCNGCFGYAAYYNNCTGWVWAWSGFEPGDVIGHQVADGDLCFSTMHSAIYVVEGAPPGYGFTGEIRLSNSGEDSCPAGATVQTQPFLPVAGWNVTEWAPWGNEIAHTALVQIVMGERAENPVAFATDLGSSGSPPPCGTCYPTTRIARSFYYGSDGSPLCPAEPLLDGCPVSLLVEACYVFNCDLPRDCDAAVTVGSELELRSWGGVKALYR